MNLKSIRIFTQLKPADARDCMGTDTPGTKSTEQSQKVSQDRRDNVIDGHTALHGTKWE